MAKTVTTIDELAQLMTAGFETMNNRFDLLEVRMDRMEKRGDRQENRLDGIEGTQREHTRQLHELNEKVDTLIGKTTAIEDDIKEFYALVTQLRQDFETHRLSQKEFGTRLDSLEAFARSIGKQTGVPFRG